MGRLSDLTRSRIKWFGGRQAEVRFGTDLFESVVLMENKNLPAPFYKIRFSFSS